MLVHHVGRRTGRRYRQPVSYVTHGTSLLTPGGGRWTDNLHEGEPVQLHLRGRTVTATPQLILDPSEVDRLLHTMAAHNPMLRRFVRVPTGADGHHDPDALAAAIRHGFRVVRWQLGTPTPDRDAAPS